MRRSSAAVRVRGSVGQYPASPAGSWWSPQLRARLGGDNLVAVSVMILFLSFFVYLSARAQHPGISEGDPGHPRPDERETHQEPA